MKTWAFIFARGGSKGLPGKNIKPLLGKPLIAYSIELALDMPEIDRVIVSTDDEAIARVSREYGAQVPFERPAELAGDRASEWLAWRHGVEWVEDHWGEFDRFVSLPATSPCRIRSDVAECLGRLTENVDIVVTATQSQHNPHFNMIKEAPSGGFIKFNDTSINVTRRQDVPQAYNMATVAYVCRPSFIRSRDSLWEGRMEAVVIDPANAVDIDTEFDFKMAELIMGDRYAQ